MKVCFKCGKYTESTTINKQGQPMTDPLDCEHKKYIYNEQKFKWENLGEELEYIPSKPKKQEANA